jgi:hypothetical protein
MKTTHAGLVPAVRLFMLIAMIAIIAMIALPLALLFGPMVGLVAAGLMWLVARFIGK